MNRFWKKFIYPIINVIKAKHIVEIGSDTGINTRNILEYCMENQAKISVIDPFPKYDEKHWLRDYNEYLEFYKELSLNALPLIKDYDAVLIDGDHNWYTVYNELKIIEKNCSDNFPVVFLHDIDWPYGRRDIYYNPDTIPAAFRKPYAKKGMKPGQPSLLESGGFNSNFFNSIYENGLQNGVLTAVEDFIKESTLDLNLYKIYGLNGLGILTPSKKINANENLKSFLEMLQVSQIVEQHIKDIDNFLLEKHIVILEKNSLLAKKEENEALLKKQIEEKVKNEALLKEQIEIAENNFLSISKELESLQQEIKEYNNKLESVEKNLENTKIELQERELQVNNLETEIEKYNTQISNLQKEIQEKKMILQDFIHRENKQQETIGLLSNWIEQLNTGIVSLLNSKRWKIGKGIGEAKNKLLFKSNIAAPEKFLKDILGQYQRWKNKEVDISQSKNSNLNHFRSYNRNTIKSFFYRNKLLFLIVMFFKYPIKVNMILLKAYFLLKGSIFFDEKLYLNLYPDVKQEGINPLLHYLYFGGFEGRIPSNLFESKYYLKENPDVLEAKMNPLVHYIFYGAKEGRHPKNEETVNLKTKLEYNLSASNINSEGYQNNSDILFVNDFNITNRPKVSIIMPTWNRINTIERAIDSVLKQSYKSYELLIIDDGSTDGTKEMLHKKYLSMIDSGVIRYIYQEHSGVCKARNTGLKYSKGDLIAYLDSDNEWLKDYLKIMVNVFDKNKEYNTAYSAIEVFDNVRNKRFIRNTPYDRKRLLTGNFIDLNIFMHRRILFEQLGGFNENLKRLVDWEFIIRLTKLNKPYFVNKVLAKYYLNKSLNNISNTEDLESNQKKINKIHMLERISYGIDKLKIGYVLWDYPALSQTFVINELRWLVENGYDVNVYYKIKPEKVADVDFNINSFCVKDDDHLAELITKHNRNMLHSHFVYPACTLLTYPAAVKTGIPFTFSAHAVDIFHYSNEKRNKIAEISNHKLCKKVYLPGNFHRNYLIERGVPHEKIMLVRQAAKYELFEINERFEEKLNRDKRVITTIARFIEKKGIEDLIKAAGLLKNTNIIFKIYGYGPLEEDYRKLIKELNLHNIELCGVLKDYQQLKSVYEETDLFVMPCVRASNGDMDGIPTVILEAMSFGVPVISTSVSVIPEIVKDGVTGFIVPPRSPEALANKIKEVVEMSCERLRRILINARDIIKNYATLEQTMYSLLDVWVNKPIDIFLVTYNTEEYNDIKETKEIINRIYKYTTTPFHLTIVDNNSDQNFIEYLRGLVKKHDNIRLVELESNIFCGSASNIALKDSLGEFIFYICSKEGFITKPGWERQCINFMRDNPKVGLAGHLISSPKFYDAKSYQQQEWFDKFRNKEFAYNNPDKEFRHVQGGIYVLRHETYKQCGGFNMQLPHNYMDVEYSYYLESCGWGLGDIDNIISLTKKTIPNVWASINEDTIALHPLSMKDIEQLNYIMEEKGKICNICGWRDLRLNPLQETYICPKCNSSGFSRTIYRYLTKSNKIYRSLKCLASINDNSLESILLKMFEVKIVKTDEIEKNLNDVGDNNKKIDMIITNNLNWDLNNIEQIANSLYKALNVNGTAIVNGALLNNELNHIILTTLERVGFKVKNILYNSNVIQYDWRNNYECKKVICKNK
jgi:glycosyltransferase involved in cell wall biosynthesis